jgi:hypothetical protein
MFFSIVRLLAPFGIFSSINLGYLRLCLDKWSTCMFVGRLPAALVVLLYRRWCFHAFCGVFGEN